MVFTTMLFVTTGASATTSGSKYITDPIDGLNVMLVWRSD